MAVALIAAVVGWFWSVKTKLVAVKLVAVKLVTLVVTPRVDVTVTAPVVGLMEMV